MLAIAVAAPTDALPASGAACGGPASVSTRDATGSSLEIVALDLSGSTGVPAVRQLYRQAAAAVLDQARSERAGFIAFGFTAASSSTNVVFAGTFDPHQGSSILDQAAVNRARCLGDAALAAALGGSAAAATTGSDIGGAIAAASQYAQPTLAARKPVRLTILTDGLQAPAASGGGRGLLDLGRALDRGRAPAAIVRAYGEQLVPREARGISLEMRGIDRQRNPVAASTARARQLVSVWTLACRSAGARTCLVTSALP